MYRAEDSYFWFVAKDRLLCDLLRRESKSSKNHRVADIGCGTGGLCARVSEWTKPVAIDSDATALKFCRRRNLNSLMQAQVENLPLESDSFDALIASDVIEHLDDDAAAVEEMYRAVSPGGAVILTVPAMPRLWGPHDLALGHKRRYTRKLLKRLLCDAGFNKVRIFSFMSTITPLIATVRLIEKYFKTAKPQETISYELPAFINSLLLVLLDFERFLARNGIDLFIGATLVAVAHKGTNLE